MTTITELTATEAAQRAAALMNKSKAVLVEKASLVGIDTAGMSKAQIVAAIVGKSATIISAPKSFDYSGLFIRI